MRDATGRRPHGTALPCAVGAGFVATYALAYMSVALMLIAPLLVTLALKIRSLVGAEQAPQSLALVTGVGGLLTLFAAPVFGRLSDRTPSRVRHAAAVDGRRAAGGVLGITVVATAPSLVVVLIGWCLAQVSFNALQAALVAVLPDQVPVTQRGTVSGVLGITVPVAAVLGTFLVQLFEGHQAAMFLAPCASAAVLVLVFVASLDDRRLERDAQRPGRCATWSRPSTWTRGNPDFAWAFAGRFLFISAYAFLTTYQAYYLLDRVGSAEADVPGQVFLATLVQSVVMVVASLVTGRLSDLTGRRKVFVAAAAVTYGLALFVIAAADTLRRLPGRHGHQRAGLRHLPGRRPGARRRRAARRGRLGARPRAVQHRQRPAVRARARCRARHPRGQRRQLRRPLRRRRGLCPPGGRCSRSDPRRALTAHPVHHLSSPPVHHVW